VGITTSSSAKSGHSLSQKQLCWDCGKHSAFFMVHPGYGYGLCGDCAKSEGLDVPIEPSDEEIGTITKGKKRGTAS
jgi:hypothetical protein